MQIAGCRSEYPKCGLDRALSAKSEISELIEPLNAYLKMPSLDIVESFVIDKLQRCQVESFQQSIGETRFETHQACSSQQVSNRKAEGANAWDGWIEHLCCRVNHTRLVLHGCATCWYLKYSEYQHLLTTPNHFFQELHNGSIWISWFCAWSFLKSCWKWTKCSKVLLYNVDSTVRSQINTYT